MFLDFYPFSSKNDAEKMPVFVLAFVLFQFLTSLLFQLLFLIPHWKSDTYSSAAASNALLCLLYTPFHKNSFIIIGNFFSYEEILIL